MATGFHDNDHTPTLMAVSSSDGKTPVVVWADESTHRLLTTSVTTITILTATGTVDNFNTAFTFSQQPNIIFVNGLGYRVNHGWSWNAGTLTATLDAPVGSGGDIFGI